MKKVMSKKNCLMSGMVLCSALLLSAGNVLATNITIYDGTQRVTPTGTGIGLEDGETEPGMVNSQVWDLEGFFLEGDELSMVGGYDFSTVGGYESGDIFLSTDDQYGNADPDYASSNGYAEVENNFGYEYVIDLDFKLSTYTVWALAPNATTKTADIDDNQNNTPGSNPWRYVSGGAAVNGGTTGSFSFNTDFEDPNLTDTGTGFTGGTHYSLTGFDLSFLDGQEFYSHFTMGCGNDNLMGHGNAPVPEPATMLLFGTGLVGLAGSRLRKKKK